MTGLWCSSTQQWRTHVSGTTFELSGRFQNLRDPSDLVRIEADKIAGRQIDTPDLSGCAALEMLQVVGDRWLLHVHFAAIAANAARKTRESVRHIYAQKHKQPPGIRGEFAHNAARHMQRLRTKPILQSVVGVTRPL